MAADFVVSMEARPVGAVRGVRDLASATKELTQETSRSGESSRRAASASSELETAERRRISAAAEMVRAVKAQITALSEYQKQILSVASTEAARAAITSRTQSSTVATAGVDPSSRLGNAMQALLERERQLRASIQDTAEELARADRVAGNIAGLQARTREMEGALATARRGEEAQRAYAEALEVRKAVEASGARPGTDQAATVVREVRAQQRLEAELRAVAAARERERRAAEAANAQRDRVAGEISRLRETTRQLEILANAHLRGRNAVREANVQLEVRNALLRQGVAAGSADAVIIEQQIRRQAQLRQQLDQVDGAKRRTAEGVNVLRNAFFALQGAIAALGLSALIRDSVQVALGMDRAQKSFVAAAGSTAGAAREMAFVTAEADRLGLVLLDTAQGYASLANAAKGTVLEGQAARDIFSAVSEAATVLGLSADQTRGALLGVQQTISKGKVTAEELVQQISERLPGAYQAMADSLGISTRELAKRLEQGKVGLQDLVGWAEEMRKRFSAGLLTAVNSDQANINRLRNLIDQVKADIGRGFLSGFLAGFSDLKKELSSEELRQAARNLGESIGSALRAAADAAAFLARHLELVKAVLVAILALRVAAFFVTLATAIAGATGATIAFKVATSNLLLAGALGGIAVVLLGVVVAMNQYIAASRLAWQTEMDRVARSQEVFNYYNTLKTNKIGLTEAEAAYALEVRKTMEAEKTALQVALARSRSKLEDVRGSLIRPWAAGSIRKEIVQQEKDLKFVENQLNILDQQWDRLSKLPTIKLPVDAGEVDKTAKKVADLLENFRRGAEQAERMAAANRQGASEARRVSAAIERENAAYQALHSLENLSADSKRKLSAIIEVLVGRTQSANLASEQTIATRERDLAYSNSAREAEARLTDMKEGSTEASRALAVALEAEAEARRLNRSEDVDFLKQLQEEISVRHEYLRSIELEIGAGQRAREWASELAGLHAQLADAQSRTTTATQSHAVALEAERLQVQAGVAAWTPKGQQLAQEAQLRAFLRGLLVEQTNAQRRLNEAQDRENAARAEFADWQQQAAFARRYGDELAGILSQYGLLSDATKELAIQEEIRQRVLEDGAAADREAIEAAVRGEHARIDAIKQAWANAEIQQWVSAPFLEAWDSIKGQFLDTLNEMILTGKADWASLWKSFLQQALQAIEQWLIRWVTAHRIAQAEAARTAAANAAAGASVAANGGGVTGNLTTIGLTGASTAATSGGTSSLATSFSTWGTYAAYGFLAWVGYNIYKGWTKARVTFGEASISGQTSGSSRIAAEMSSLIVALVKDVADLAKQWELGVISLENSNITIGRTSRGIYYVKGDFLGNVGQGFKSIEEALDFARVAALRTAEFAASTSRLVVAIIRNTRATTTAQLQEEINVARRIESFSPQPTVQAIREWEEELDALRARIIELIPRSEELAGALANISAEEIRRWQALRDQITGRQRTEAEELADRQARAQQFNAEKALRVAELKLKAIEIQQELARLRARGELVRGTGVIINGEIDAGANYLKAKAELAKAEISIYQQHLAALEAQLAAINLVITGLEAIPDISPEDVAVPRTRGGRGGGDGESLMDQVIAARRQRELEQMSDFARQQAEVNQRWDEAIRGQGLQSNALERAKRAHEAAIKAANGNAEAIKKADEAYQRQTRHIRQSQEAIDAANVERQRELQLIRARAIESLYAGVKAYEEGGRAIGGGPVSGLDSIRREADKQRADFLRQAAGLSLGADRIARGLARINAAEQARVAVLTEQVIDGLGLPMEQAADKAASLGETIRFLRDRVADGTISAARFGSVFREMSRQAEGELLGLAAGILENMGQTEEAAKLKAALEEANFELQIIQLNVLYQQYLALGLVSDGARAKLDAALAIINDPANRVPPPPADTRRFQGYDDAPGTGSSGTAANTQLDAARRFAEAVDSYVRATEDLLVDPDLSILSPEEQVARLKTEFYETLAAAQGGDAEAAARLGDVQKQLLEAAKRAYGGGQDALGNAGYIALFQELIAAGQGLVNSPAAQAAFSTVDAVQQQGERTHRDLQELIRIMQEIRDATGGQVYYAPQAFGASSESFAPQGRPGRSGVPLIGSGVPPRQVPTAAPENLLQELVNEVRGMRREQNEHEHKRRWREESIADSSRKTAANTAGRPYSDSRQASRGMFRT